MIIDDYAAEVVKDIFNWKLEGISTKGIANKLNETGILSPMEYKKSIGLNYKTGFKTKSQAMWSAVAVSRILQDEIYTGTLSQGKEGTQNYKIKKRIKKPKNEWIQIQNNHEPIISKFDFEKVRNILSSKTRSLPGNEAVYTFAGILKCGYCGHNMIRKNILNKSKKYTYYVCSKHRATKSCENHSINETLLEKSVLLLLQQHISSRNTDSIISAIKTEPQKNREIKKAELRLEVKHFEIEKYKKILVSLYENIHSGIINQEDYIYLKMQYSTIIKESENAVSQYKKQIESLTTTADIDEHANTLENRLNISKLSRKLVLSLINNIYIYKNKTIDIHLNYSDKLTTYT